VSCHVLIANYTQTVVALLSPPAPSAARSELKKLMMQRNVRKSISDGILTRILAPVTATSGASTPAPDAEPKESGSGFRSGATTPAEDIPVVYVST
jgi:hypothetical protein